MLNYQVILENPLTSDIYHLVLKKFSFVEKLNSEPVGSFELSFEEMRKIARTYATTVTDMFTAGRRNIYIYRNGVKILDSVIDDIEIVPEANGERRVTIKTVGLFGLLTKRFAGIPVRRFVATDAGEIAWTLINETQLDDPPYSDLGITEGTITASKDRDRSYYFDEIRDSIWRLSNDNLANGFDFEIDNTRAFNVFYPSKGQNRPNLVFNSENLIGYTWKERIGRGITNRAYVTGEGQNEDILYAVEDSLNSYKEPFGLMESKEEETDVSVLDTLEDKATRIITDLQESAIIFPTLIHSDKIVGWEQYALGDNVKCDLPVLDLNNTYRRVISREFAVDEDSGVATISTELK